MLSSCKWTLITVCLTVLLMSQTKGMSEVFLTSNNQISLSGPISWSTFNIILIICLNQNTIYYHLVVVEHNNHCLPSILVILIIVMIDHHGHHHQGGVHYQTCQESLQCRWGTPSLPSLVNNTSIGPFLKNVKDQSSISNTNARLLDIWFQGSCMPPLVVQELHQVELCVF